MDQLSLDHKYTWTDLVFFLDFQVDSWQCFFRQVPILFLDPNDGCVPVHTNDFTISKSSYLPQVH